MTTADPDPQKVPRMVSPYPEAGLRISGVDEDDLLGLSNHERLEGHLDRYDLDLGMGTEGPTDHSFNHYFLDKEELCKMKSLAEIAKSLLPEDHQKPQELIAEAMQSMPLDAREQIVRDLYGIDQTNVHTSTASHIVHVPVTPLEQCDPQFLETKLQQMETELKQLKAAMGWNLKVAPLEIAESQNLEYTTCPKFRLSFLRTDRFDATRAAARFIRYFDLKMELFGEAALTRDITQGDLTKEEKVML